MVISSIGLRPLTGSCPWAPRVLLHLFLFIQMVHRMEILWLVLVFPSKPVISMRLSDSASNFTAEIWAIIKALEQIKYSVASKYIVFTDSLLCLQALQSMKLEHPLIGDLPKKTLFFVGYPAILTLGVMKGKTLLPSLH